MFNLSRKECQLFRLCQWIGNSFVLAAGVTEHETSSLTSKREGMSATHPTCCARHKYCAVLETVLRSGSSVSRHHRCHQW